MNSTSMFRSETSGSLLSKIVDLRASHLALSIVRITFFIVSALEFLQLYWYRAISFRGADWWVADILLPFSILAMLFLVVGWRIRFWSIVNYFLVFYIMGRVIDHYHIDHAIRNVSFIFLLAPASQCLSLDAKRNPHANPALMIPAWFVALMFLGIELVYFDSLFYKFINRIWMEGSAFWLPAALPHFSTGLLPEWVEHEWLMRGLSYTALVLETTFPLILLRGFKLPVWLVGFGLHLGIIIFFPIPLFGAVMCALYFLFVDWGKVLSYFGVSTLRNDELVKPESGQRWLAASRRVGWIIVFVMTLAQCLLILARYFPKEHWVRAQLGGAAVRVARPMGIAGHGVYVDAHFSRQTPLLRFSVLVDGKEVEVPTFTEQSYPSYPETTGRYWVFHMFYVRNDYRNTHMLLDRIWSRFLRGWMVKEGIEPKDIDVKLYYHHVAPVLTLDFEADERIESGTWSYGGIIHFDENSKAVGQWESGFEELMNETRRGRK